MKKLIIIGASGHGKVVADIAKKNGYENIIFLDDNESIKTCGQYPVLGKTDAFTDYDGDVFVGIGNNSIRKRIMEMVEKEGRIMPTLIHPNAVIADDVTMSHGIAVMAGAVINSGAVLGKGCIVNTSSSVDHDCRLGDYVHVAVGAHIAGTVIIGEGSWIGAGSTIINNLNVCDNCMIGAGAVIVKDIVNPGTYIGVPAHSK